MVVNLRNNLLGKSVLALGAICSRNKSLSVTSYTSNAKSEDRPFVSTQVNLPHTCVLSSQYTSEAAAIVSKMSISKEATVAEVLREAFSLLCVGKGKYFYTLAACMERELAVQLLAQNEIVIDTKSGKLSIANDVLLFTQLVQLSLSHAKFFIQATNTRASSNLFVTEFNGAMLVSSHFYRSFVSTSEKQAANLMMLCDGIGGVSDCMDSMQSHIFEILSN